ncbi:hypothetical protein NE237_011310 [Protea cynaroides]|uniref:Uncharacterized protein n=1 Tax=Protea cynaroides TaxID=273540 RepID=A0A9Q0JWV7_9MAGN|nr:hypothetical protein NE237_011310 [Protea cynaroides]
MSGLNIASGTVWRMVIMAHLKTPTRAQSIEVHKEDDIVVFDDATEALGECFWENTLVGQILVACPRGLGLFSVTYGSLRHSMNTEIGLSAMLTSGFNCLGYLTNWNLWIWFFNSAKIGLPNPCCISLDIWKPLQPSILLKRRTIIGYRLAVRSTSYCALLPQPALGSMRGIASYLQQITIARPSLLTAILFPHQPNQDSLAPPRPTHFSLALVPQTI